MNIIEGLVEEIERCARLKAVYEELPSGFIGALIIQTSIDKAKRAISSGDIELMVAAYEDLKSRE